MHKISSSFLSRCRIELRAIKFSYGITAAILLAAFLPLGSNAASAELSEAEKSTIRSLSLDVLPPKPVSPSNRFADNEKAQQLGEQLFFDTKLSGNNQMACSTCHLPEMFFTDGRALSQGASESGRNTPTVVGSAWLRWLYWDGRKDSLWSQALIPLEASNEMASDRVAVVRYITTSDSYRQQYEQIFGKLDSAIDILPTNAGPFGNEESKSEWAALSPALKKIVNKTFVNVGKALAAYQRTLTYEPTRFDRFTQELQTETTEYSLDADEIAGLKLFIDSEKTQCLQCHNGPLFTNRGFHNVGTGGLHGERLDFGRMVGLQAVIQDEFNCLGEYSDAMPEECSSLRFLNRSAHMPVQGAFKTPSLRNLSQTAPYFHDGRFATTKQVVEFYNNPPRSGGHELLPLNLTEQEIDQLIQFLATISDQ